MITAQGTFYIIEPRPYYVPPRQHIAAVRAAKLAIIAWARRNAR